MTFNTYSSNTVESIIGVVPIACASIAIINPIIEMLAGTTGGVFGLMQNAYQGYVEKNKKEDPISYEEKKAELQKIQQKLVAIKNSLQIIKGLSPESFTYQFLKQYFCVQVQKDDLMSLEKQIVEIQFILRLHFNQLIENVGSLRALYDLSMLDVNVAIHFWENNCYRITPDLAGKVYEHYIFRELLINSMQQVLHELGLVLDYYRNCSSESLKSIGIALSLDKARDLLAQTKVWYAQEKELARRTSAVVQRYFNDRNISVIALRNTAKKEFDETFKKRNAEVLKNIGTQQQLNSGFGGGPKKDDEEKIEISEEDKDHIFRESEGHFVKDTSQNRKTIEDIVADKNNYNGLDKYGTKWYSKVTSDGQQVWAGVRNNKIRYAGMNKVPWPKDITTGLLIRPASNLKT